MKQVHEYVNQQGKCSDVLANADLPDQVASFQYPLVHWACVLGKFKVLERLAAMKEFNLGVQSERTGETGLHRMLMSLDQAMVRKKSPSKTILEVFSKTLRTLTENLPRLITICNKEGDTLFHCLAKVILDSTGELERMNMYEGYFECLVKELTRLRSTGKLTLEVVRELLLKTNNSQETFLYILILVPRAHDPSGLWQGSRALGGPDFLSMRRVFVSNSQPFRFARFDGKSVNRGLPVLDQTRALDPCHRPEGSWVLGTRMVHLGLQTRGRASCYKERPEKHRPGNN